MLSTELCIATCFALLAHLAGSELSAGNRKQLTYGCPSSSRRSRHDFLTLRVPLKAAPGAGDKWRPTLRADGCVYRDVRTSLNASLCPAGSVVTMEMTAQRKGATAIEETYYIIRVDGRGINATTVWLYWSFAGTSDCSLKKQLEQEKVPCVIVIDEDGGDGRPMSTLLIENITGHNNFSFKGVEVDNQSFNYTQFTQGTDWFSLRFPKIDLNAIGIYVLYTSNKHVVPSYFPVKFPTRMKNISNVTLESCSDGRGKSTLTSVRASSGQNITYSMSTWLAICLCAAITVIGIGILIFNCCPGTQSAQSPQRHQRTQVALTGGPGFLRSHARHLRRRLSLEAVEAARPVSYAVINLDDLRLQSKKFDRVLLFLGPDEIKALPEELKILLAQERWRFVLPEAAEGDEGNQQPGAALLENGVPRNCVLFESQQVGATNGGAGDCDGAGDGTAVMGALMENMILQVNKACSETIQRCQHH